ncbi:hypothetical protein [Nocardia asiatica]|uniref:hypothetical protein n=1 Tax=Nocardia asiatica TaxID=209252 RepID=UPI00245445BB|nr:hypothetical protein [Nocardia asiatica]
MPAISDAFNNDDTRLGRFLTAAAHLSLWALAVMVTVRVFGYLGVHHWLIDIGDLTATASILIALMHTTITRLCVRCMEEVPGDAAARAQRQSWLLRIAHSLDSFTRVMVWVALLVATATLATLLDLPRVVHAPLDAFFALYLYSTWLHHKLRPWCPYCRRWDDGDGIHEPSPDPVEKATR